MKRTIDVGIGGRAFTLDEDAHERLEIYLKKFEGKLSFEQKGEVMPEIESRIAELFQMELGSQSQVVDINLVERVIKQLGMPDGSEENPTNEPNLKNDKKMTDTRKLYRDPDDKKIAGVCSGLAAFFNVDVTLVRIIMLVAFLCGSAGLWIYLVIWIIAPIANTPAQKCEMHGLPVNAENMSRFTFTEK